MFLKSRFPWLIFLVLLLCAVQSRADSVTLKTGEKVSGTIKSETDTDVIIDVPVSAAITDERDYKKTDLANIDKAQPDEIAYQQLIAVQPNQQLSYSSDGYAKILDSLTAFEKQYPASTYLPQVQKLAATFQDEKKRVDAGQVKYMGKWLTPDEAARQRPQIAALETFDAMQQQVTVGDIYGAMQSFDSIEHNYPGTRGYVAAVALAQQVIVQIQADLTARIAQLKADQIQLKATIAATAPGPDRTNLIAAAQQEQSNDTATIQNALQSGVRWVPLIPRSQVSIATLQKTATSEAQTLGSLQLSTMTASIDKSDAAQAAVDAGDYASADTLDQQASSLWSANLAAKDLALVIAAGVKATHATPAPKPTPTPKPLPSVRPRPISTAPTPTPVPDKPFLMTIQGAFTVVIAVLVFGGIVAVINKRRANQTTPE